MKARLAFLFLFAASPAFAAEKSLGSFGAWRAYAYKEGGQQVCYMVTEKLLKSAGPKKRAAPYLMITHRPTEASSDVISYSAGHLFAGRDHVQLRVGADNFDLFSMRDTAWARDPRTDHKIAAALRAAKAARFSSLIQGRKKPQRLIDSFDLTGAPDAYAAIGKACGLIRAAPHMKTKTAKKPARRTP